MNNFEKQVADWIDGKMTDAERAAFEASIPESRRGDRDRWLALGAAMRSGLAEKPSISLDVINHRVAEAIAQPAAPLPSLKKYFWMGLGSLAAATLVTLAFLPSIFPERSEEEFISHVIDVRAERPELSISIFDVPDQSAVVLWIDGDDYIPPDQTIP
jgi:hypothetical protein